MVNRTVEAPEIASASMISLDETSCDALAEAEPKKLMKAELIDELRKELALADMENRRLSNRILKVLVASRGTMRGCARVLSVERNAEGYQSVVSSQHDACNEVHTPGRWLDMSEGGCRGLYIERGFENWKLLHLRCRQRDR